MKRTLPALMVLILILAACGGEDAGGDTEPTTTAGTSQSSDTTETTEAAATETTAAPESEASGTPGAATVDDPAGDLLGGVDPSTDCGAAPTGSIDLATVTVAATDVGFSVDLAAYEPGEILQIKIVLTAPNGDYYDARARKDGNHTFDGGGAYAWESGADITLDGGDDSYTVTVANVFPEAGWVVELTSRSPCGEDEVELTLG